MRVPKSVPPHHWHVETIWELALSVLMCTQIPSRIEIPFLLSDRKVQGSGGVRFSVQCTWVSKPSIVKITTRGNSRRFVDFCRAVQPHSSYAAPCIRELPESCITWYTYLSTMSTDASFPSQTPNLPSRVPPPTGNIVYDSLQARFIANVCPEATAYVDNIISQSAKHVTVCSECPSSGYCQWSWNGSNTRAVS